MLSTTITTTLLLLCVCVCVVGGTFYSPAADWVKVQPLLLWMRAWDGQGLLCACIHAHSACKALALNTTYICLWFFVLFTLSTNKKMQNEIIQLNEYMCIALAAYKVVFISIILQRLMLSGGEKPLFAFCLIVCRNWRICNCNACTTNNNVLAANKRFVACYV